MQILSGHISPETAYVVEDYPYGFRLRCQIRYWIEYKPSQGFRFVSQTTNPKHETVRWNKPKASTYCKFGAAMYLDDIGHVHWAGLSEYSDAKEAVAFAEKYGAGVPEAGAAVMRKWVASKVAYEAARTPETQDLTTGVIEARKAWIETK